MLPMVMGMAHHIGNMLFKNVGDAGPWCWLVWGGLFLRKRGNQQGRTGFLDRQHLSITDNLEIAMGSDS